MPSGYPLQPPIEDPLNGQATKVVARQVNHGLVQTLEYHIEVECHQFQHGEVVQ